MKKKLLFINGHLNTGGVEKSLLDILQHLDYDKFDVDLLLTEALGDYAPQLPKRVNIMLRSLEGTYGSFPKVILHSIHKRDWFSLKMRLILQFARCFGGGWLALAKRLLTDGREYDCAIGFRQGICTQIAAYAVNAKQRISWWHHGEIETNAVKKLAEMHCIDKIVAVSEGCREMMLQTMPSLERRVITIHNMLDPEWIRKSGTRTVYFRGAEMLHIASVGRLAAEKHFDNAIRAAKVLKEKGFSFQWHLVGDGPERNALQALAKELEVSDCFIFEGNQVNPYPYMQHADLFVHPSYVESFGIVVAEALTLGIPCVVTKSIGVMDFLKDGENAVLTEQNPESLTRKVLEVLEDKALQTRLKMNCHCPEHLLPTIVMEKIEDVLGI